MQLPAPLGQSPAVPYPTLQALCPLPVLPVYGPNVVIDLSRGGVLSDGAAFATGSVPDPSDDVLLVAGDTLVADINRPLGSGAGTGTVAVKVPSQDGGGLY